METRVVIQTGDYPYVVETKRKGIFGTWYWKFESGHQDKETAIDTAVRLTQIGQVIWESYKS